MWKKLVVGFLTAIYLFSTAVSVFAEENPVFDKSRLNSGVIKINYSKPDSSKLKCMIQKQDKTYYYDLSYGDTFPLQFGNGEYTVAVLENIEGKKYRVVERDTVNLELENENDVFLTSIKLINWNEKMAAVKKAKELTKNLKTDMEKVNAIYNYITKQITYDDKKINLIGPDYLPVIDDVLKKRKGICYDYSSLFAAMLRSVSVPAKLVMGYQKDIEGYHAWNEVYMKDQEKWITVDTTYDSTLRQSNLAFSMIKEDGQYQVDKEY